MSEVIERPVEAGARPADAPAPQRRGARRVSSIRAGAVRDAVAIVLAGGRGTRLERLTDWRATPAVSFGGACRIIDFTLSNCVNSGLRRIRVCTQYRAQSLIGHLQRAWIFLDGRFDEFVELLPAQQRVDEQWYRCTADAVYRNIDLLLRQDPQYLVVLAGGDAVLASMGVYVFDAELLYAALSRDADDRRPCVSAVPGKAGGSACARARPLGDAGIQCRARTEPPARRCGAVARCRAACCRCSRWRRSSPPACCSTRSA